MNDEIIKKATVKDWIGLAILALPCIIYSMDLTILNLAIPSISEDLNPTTTQLLWIVDIYGFLLAGFLITMGTLGDKIGRKKLLLIGAVIFGIASVIAAFSSSTSMLIFSRALLGIAGATLAPSTLSLLRNMFEDPKQRTIAIGVWITSFSFGGAIGPVVGGILLENYWWGSVFLTSIPVMLLLLILGPRLLPEFRDPKAGKIDFWSVFLSLVSMLSVIYGLKGMIQKGIDGQVLIILIIGIGMGALFIKRQKKLVNPLLDLTLFKQRNFGFFLGLYTFSTFALFGMFFFIAQYLQLVLELSPFNAGLWSLPSALAFIIGSMGTPILTRSIHPIYIMAIGLVLATLGFSLLLLLQGGSDLLLLVFSLGLFSIGISPVFTLATDFIVSSAPPERAGIAASLSETSSELGGALGIAVLGSIGAFVYQKAMPTLDLNVANSMSTDTQSLGGVISASKSIPPEKAEVLIGYAVEAFTKSTHMAAGLSAIITIVLAISCLIHIKSKAYAN